MQQASTQMRPSSNRVPFTQSHTQRPVSSSTRRHTTRPNTEYAPSGDLVFESIDGHSFNVHSVLLSLASPVFADMLEVGTNSPGGTIALAETGETVELMLKFICPRQSPTISSFEMLERALHVANKYQIEDMQRQLRRELSLPGSPTSLYTHPLDALSVASAHNLKDEASRALKAAQHHYDFNSIEGLMKLAGVSPASIPFILLIGTPGVKCNILSSILFNFNAKPMNPSGLPLCPTCKDYLDRNSPDTHYSPPEWLARWAHGLFKTLKIRPREDWKACFDVGFLFKAVGRYGGTPIRTMNGNCTCLDSFSRREGARAFLRWSEDVYDCLAARLVGLRELEGLME